MKELLAALSPNNLDYYQISARFHIERRSVTAKAGKLVSVTVRVAQSSTVSLARACDMNRHDLDQLATSLGVELKLDTSADGNWRIELIQRTRNNRGAGEMVLRTINALADEHCARVRLPAEPNVKRKGRRKTRLARLIRFYERLDFVVLSYNDMIRWPMEG